MPIYEYRCSSCGHQQEFMQKLSDPTLTICNKCNQPTFSKMLTAAGFQLKGSGWYVTDFKNKGSSAAKPGGKGAEGAGGDKAAGGESSTGDKPAGDTAGADKSSAAKPAETKSGGAAGSKPAPAAGGSNT